VTNNGNNPDSVTIYRERRSVAVHRKPNPRHAESGSKRLGQCDGTHPLNEPALTVDIINLSVTSVRNLTRVAYIDLTTTVSGQTFGLNLTVDNASQWGLYNVVFTYRFNLTNLGNNRDFLTLVYPSAPIGGRSRAPPGPSLPMRGRRSRSSLTSGCPLPF